MYERSNADSNSIYQDIKAETRKDSENHFQDIASENKRRSFEVFVEDN